MSQSEITFEEYRALSDEEREILRMDAACAILEEKAADLFIGTSDVDRRLVESIAATTMAEEAVVTQIVAALAAQIAKDIAATGKATFPGVGVIRRSEKTDDGPRVLSVGISETFEKAIEG